MTAVSLSADQPPKRQYDEAEAHRVYDALLSSKYFYKGPDRPVWVIRTETEGSIWPECMPKPEDLDFDEWQTVRDFVKENQSLKALDPRFSWSVSVAAVPRKELPDSVDDDLAWNRFHVTYLTPRARSRFRHRHNERRDALVMTTFKNGLLCGGVLRGGERPG
jgi:hypothetical protein